MPRVAAAMVVALLVAACTSSQRKAAPVITTAPVATTVATTTTEPPPPTTTTTTRPVVAGHWRVLAAAPAGADQARYVWTDRGVAAWGGDWAGAAYSIASDAWTTLPTSPLSVRDTPGAVWTGSQVVFWGGHRAGGNVDPAVYRDGTAYDPATRQWRKLAPAPVAGRDAPVMVWTGREVIVSGGTAQCCPIDSIPWDHQVAGYNPSSDTWRRLPDAPAWLDGAGGDAVTVVDGTRMLVFHGGAFGALDLRTAQWAQLESPNIPTENCYSTGGVSASGLVVGRQLIVWAAGCRGQTALSYGLDSGHWRSLSDTDASSGYPAGARLAATASTVYAVVVRGNAPVLRQYDVSADHWSDLNDPPAKVGAFPTLAVRGNELFVFGAAAPDRRVVGAALGLR